MPGGGGGERSKSRTSCKVVFLCWIFLEVYIFPTTYQTTLIVGLKVPYPTQPFPTPPTPPYPTLPYPYLHPTLPYPTLPYPTLPYPSLPYPTLPYPTLPYPTLPYPTLPYPTLPYPTLPYPTLPYPTSTLPLPFPTSTPTPTPLVELRCHATALINRIIIQQCSKFKLKKKCLHSTANDFFIVSSTRGGGGYLE